MAWLYMLIKIIAIGSIVVGANEAAKRNPTLGAIIISLPLMTVVSIALLWFNTHSSELARQYGIEVLKLLPPSAMFFIVLAVLTRPLGFWGAFCLGLVATPFAYKAWLMAF